MTADQPRSSAPAVRATAMRQHAISVLVVLLLIGVVVAWLTTDRATAEADRDAEEKVRSTALAAALPLTHEDLAGDGGWQRRLAANLRPMIDADEIATAHVWHRLDETTGELLWSSDQDRIGDVVPLGGAAEALDTGATVTDRLSDGSESEGPATANLWEVYLPFEDDTGTAYVLEIYRQVHEYDEVRATLLRDWLPITLLGVLAVGVITLPLSLRLARAVGSAEGERAAFADRALSARSEENQRIAEILHNRTVQDLSAVRLLLEEAKTLPSSPEVSEALDRSAAIIASDVDQLRSLLTTGEAIEWQSDHLPEALTEWIKELPTTARITTELDLATPDDDAAALDQPAVALLLRIVKEAVRNSIKHAAPEAVHIRLRLRPDAWVGAEVIDDGTGIPLDSRPGTGLRIIQQSVTAAGGEVTVGSPGTTGTLLRVTLPRSPGNSSA